MRLLTLREVLEASPPGSESGRAALSFSLLPLVAGAQGNQKSAESKDGPPWKNLIADLEKQIPQLMKKAKVPGLSIAIIKDAKLFWRRAFGVKDNASKEPVDNDTVFEAKIWKSGYVIMTNGENSGFYGVIAKLISGEILSRFLGGKLPDNPA